MSVEITVGSEWFPSHRTAGLRLDVAEGSQATYILGCPNSKFGFLYHLTEKLELFDQPNA